MTILQEILNHNKKFVENKEYENYSTTKYPEKKMVILSCMDTRLTELLPKAMSLKNGDVKLIKNAGAIVTQPFGNIMRSIIVAIYALRAQEVCVVGHHDCGMTGLNAGAIIENAKERGISQEVFDTITHSGIDLDRWLTGFDNVHDSVKNSVSIIRNHPLLPPGVPVHGLIIDPATGKLDVVETGYSSIEV